MLVALPAQLDLEHQLARALHERVDEQRARHRARQQAQQRAPFESLALVLERVVISRQSALGRRREQQQIEWR